MRKKITAKGIFCSILLGVLILCVTIGVYAAEKSESGYAYYLKDGMFQWTVEFFETQEQAAKLEKDGWTLVREAPPAGAVYGLFEYWGNGGSIGWKPKDIFWFSAEQLDLLNRADAFDVTTPEGITDPREAIYTFYFGESKEEKVTSKAHAVTFFPLRQADGPDYTPVPMDKLANKKSLQKKATDEELALAYDIAVELVRPLAGLNREEQLEGVTRVVREWFESGMDYSMQTPHYNDPYGYFICKTASCAGCVRATGLCLNILGIPYEHVNENQYSHQWARVQVGDTYWICDAYGLYCGPEPEPYQHPWM